jgi:3-deoxy-manno-octulosonate cytidylyltransferase (CMP-KDO synthetase)
MEIQFMSERERKSSLGIIPARYASVRFPAKALFEIQGKPLIQHTYERALLCSDIDRLVVATDDTRIAQCVIAFGGDVVMTSVDCLNGTERLAEVVRENEQYQDYEIIVNIQGDEPCFKPSTLSALIDLLQQDDSAVMATPVTPIRRREDFHDPHTVKCVLDKDGHALYFSRSGIPYGEAASAYHHLGLYAYTKSFLLTYADLCDTPLQQSESLEQLKALEHGYRINVAVVEDAAIGVDTPEDIQKVEAHLCKENTSLSQAALLVR